MSDTKIDIQLQNIVDTLQSILRRSPTLCRRDEFAIRLAQGELAGTAPGEEWGSEEQRAKWVVKATDALIAELDKKEQNDGQE